MFFSFPHIYIGSAFALTHNIGNATRHACSAYPVHCTLTTYTKHTKRMLCCSHKQIHYAYMLCPDKNTTLPTLPHQHQQCTIYATVVQNAASSWWWICVATDWNGSAKFGVQFDHWAGLRPKVRFRFDETGVRQCHRQHWPRRTRRSFDQWRWKWGNYCQCKVSPTYAKMA